MTGSPMPRMHVARRRFLALLRDDASFKPGKSETLKWAEIQGFVADGAITATGRIALADAEIDPDHKSAAALLPKLAGKTLCRQSSNQPEAQFDGFVYFTEPDHKVIPAVVARILIDEGHMTAQEDGLFAGISQTFVVAAHG